ncbi:MAG: PfkB family carbohydrate kinase [Rhodobacteraceae bacterium]|jgi:ribokinase|nr:PfkB family carbohydrate kinase [Paracoccaceae bacterium]
MGPAPPPVAAPPVAGLPDLVVVGGLTVDNVVAADGTLGLGQAGGNGAYGAVGALHWVDRVGLVSQAVASYPRDVLDRLAGGGVDLAGVVFVETDLRAGTWFFYQPNGDRDERFQGAPGDLVAAGFPADRLTPSQRAAWHAHLAAAHVDGAMGYATFRERNPLTPAQVPEAWWTVRGMHLAPSSLPVMTAMLDRAPPGLTVIADPGWQLARHPLEALRPILARLDAFLPSEVELRGFVPGAGLSDALAVLGDACPGAVAVKLGPRGVLVWDRAARRAVLVPARPVTALDPTGAGDVFCGGFLAGLVETADPVQAAAFGAAAAARAVCHFGADGALPVDRGRMRAALAPTPETTPP